MAMMTALMMGVVILGVGAALDYTLMNNQSSDLQNMADAAVLAAARSGEDDPAKLQKIAQAVVNSHNVDGPKLTVKARLDGDIVVVDITSEHELLIPGMGDEPKRVSVTSASPRPSTTPINLALVLDTTDSMHGANIAALKLASSALLTEMENVESETRVSIVPFSDYVNIGYKEKAKDNRHWIDRKDEGHSWKSCWDRTNWKGRTCKKVGKTTHPVYKDGKFMGNQTRDKWSCTGGSKTIERVCGTHTKKWHGCMGTRENDKRAQQADYDGVKLPVAINQTCGTPIMPLSSNFAEMRTRVQSLSTRGETYLPSGLIWGWRTLDPELPYTEAASTRDPELMTAMLFMTDGANTRSRGKSSGNSSGTDHEYKKDGGAAGLKLTKDLCEAIKDDGIHVFVVAYQMPGKNSTAQVLSDCATDSSTFFEPENAQQLVSSFRDIAKMLNQTRLIYHETDS
ncbi:pilus assembly protein TadG-related protein [Algimonas porphyrae]|uniref:Putative Flp pilus-assembly TadG-like N-terminal domain-containing protein n=2 Tax=Algimonas porphyrae TaxID=1128113 RepID=A0ABQ5V173_9PROT|nr:hypothetical protein GCM10007854_13840 [Algimonas porphyrae]